MSGNENTTTYFYDSLLNRNVYGVVPNSEELKLMESIVNMYSLLTADSKEYLLVRLDMLKGSNE